MIKDQGTIIHICAMLYKLTGLDKGSYFRKFKINNVWSQLNKK
jgi:hypothetical protein